MWINSKLMKYLVFFFLVIHINAYDDFLEIKQDPVQKKVKEKIIELNGYKLRTLFKYKLQARVVSIKKYNWDDLSGIATHDLGIVWGKLSKTNIYSRFNWNQKNRFLIYEAKESLINNLGGKDYVNSHIANIHIIPRSKNIEELLNTVKSNDIITIKGILVDIFFKNKVVYTSVRRDDIGPGACEVILAYEVKVKHAPKYFNSKKIKLIEDKDLDFKHPGAKTRLKKLTSF